MGDSRFYIEERDFYEGQKIDITGRVAHHIGRVLRLVSGQEIEVFNGRGLVAKAKIDFITKESVAIKIISIRKDERKSRQVLLVAICKMQKMSLIVQKATELGVAKIWPIESEYSQKNKSNCIDKDKVARLESIALHALQQCGLNYLPEISPSRTLPDILKEDLSKYKLCMADAKGLNFMDMEYTGKDLLWAVGPEGGWSEDEKSQMLSYGFESVGLSLSTLRMETAAIVALAGGNWLLQK